MIDSLRALLTRRTILLGIGLLALFGAALVVARALGASLTPESLRDTLAGLGPWGPLALIVALAALLVLPLLPASLLQIAAGLAFGPWLGLLYVLIADALGAAAGFVLARRFGRTLLDERLDESQRASIESLAARITWRSVLVLRLLPGPAYPLVSFAAGYAAIAFPVYLVSSLLGVAPALALLVLAGDLVTSSPLLALGIVALLVGGLALASRLLTRARPS